MRDIAVVMILLGCIALTLRTPWHGVLALSVFAYLNPHRYAWGFSTTLPVFQTLFIVLALSYLAQRKDSQPIPRDWRIPVFYLLWFYFFLTTISAVFPVAAWPRIIDISKIYLPLIFTLLLINTREKLYYLIIAIAASFGLIAAKGGIFAFLTGFSYHTLGPANTHFGGNNEFAIATLVTIPLVILWMRETTHKQLKLALMAAVALMFASAVSSQSRGALVTIVALIPVLLWHSRRKYLAVPFLLIGLLAAVAVLPDQWFGRMETIQSYEEDKSAMGRLEVWQDGIAYALSHPLTGAGFDGWIIVTARDWHSAYVEILAEHGFIAFFLWLSLLYGTMLSLTRLPRMTRHVPEMRWVANYAYMLRASLVAYAVGSLFLGISYWDYFYHLVFIAVLVKKFALEELAQFEGRAPPQPINPAPLRSHG